MTRGPLRFEVTPGEWDATQPINRPPAISAVYVSGALYLGANGWHATLADADEALLRGARREPLGQSYEIEYRVAWDDGSAQRGTVRFNDAKPHPATGWLRDQLVADADAARAGGAVRGLADPIPWGAALTERLRVDALVAARRFAFGPVRARSRAATPSPVPSIRAVRVNPAGTPPIRYPSLREADAVTRRYVARASAQSFAGENNCLRVTVDWHDDMHASFILPLVWVDDDEGSPIGRASLRHAESVLDDTYPWPDADQRRAWANELRRRIGAAMVSGLVGAAPRPAPRLPRNAWSGEPLLRLPGGAEHLGPRDVVRDPAGSIGALLADVGLRGDVAAMRTATVRDVNRLANRLTASLQASLPTSDRYDTIAIWDAWGRALRAIQAGRKAHAMDGPYPSPALVVTMLGALHDWLVRARDQPGAVWAAYCPWKADFATLERLYPESV